MPKGRHCLFNQKLTRSELNRRYRERIRESGKISRVFNIERNVIEMLHEKAAAIGCSYADVLNYLEFKLRDELAL